MLTKLLALSGHLIAPARHPAEGASPAALDASPAWADPGHEAWEPDWPLVQRVREAQAKARARWLAGQPVGPLSAAPR